MNDTAKRVDDAIAAGDTKSVIEQLAALSAIEYGRRRKEEAKKIGVTVGTLDREVNNLRTKQSIEGNFLPHWRVQPSSEEVDGAVLINDLCQQFTRYLVLPKKTAPALALWVLHTWVFECFDITPYLSITSPTKRCGKTVLMTMLYWLTCRGKKSDSMSKPAIYRSVEGEKPTLVLDEVGWVLDLKDERQGILCGGFERNGYVEVCEGEGTDITTRRFSTYCPKAFGLIGKLTPTLEDRSIRILMDRKPRGAKVERLRRRDNDEFAQLRQRCLRWANDNAKALAQTPPMALDWLNDRALDFWEPLLTIADQIGGDLPEVAREAAKALSGEREGGSEDDVRIELLKDIRRVFGDADAIRSADLVAQLVADPERPWADWRHGRALTPKQLGGLLRPFGICSETVGPLGAQAKGYKRIHFEEAWDLYCPAGNSARPGLAISKRQSVKEPMKPEQPSDFRNVNKGSIDGSKNGNLSYSHAGFDGLTHRKSLDGGEQGFEQAGGSAEDRPGSPAESSPATPLRPQPQPAGPRPATNGKGAPGAFTDDKGRPTDDPDHGYYGRTEHAQIEEAYEAAVADVPHVPNHAEPQPPAADVIDKADQARQEIDQQVSASDPVLVMQDSKEDAGVPPQAKQPDAVADVPNQGIEKFLVSPADAARYGAVYRRLRQERGEPAARAEMSWELSAVAMVPPNKLPRELERIQRLAGH
jgi:Protein of unknown function (DUF3631)